MFICMRSKCFRLRLCGLKLPNYLIAVNLNLNINLNLNPNINHKINVHQELIWCYFKLRLINYSIIHSFKSFNFFKNIITNSFLNPNFINKKTTNLIICIKINKLNKNCKNLFWLRLDLNHGPLANSLHVDDQRHRAFFPQKALYKQFIGIFFIRTYKRIKKA